MSKKKQEKKKSLLLLKTVCPLRFAVYLLLCTLSVWAESIGQQKLSARRCLSVSRKRLRLDVCYYKSGVTAAALSAFWCSRSWWEAGGRFRTSSTRIWQGILCYSLQTIITFKIEHLCIKEIGSFLMAIFNGVSPIWHCNYNRSKYSVYIYIYTVLGFFISHICNETKWLK